MNPSGATSASAGVLEPRSRPRPENPPVLSAPFPMPNNARLQVTSGPDRGKSFELKEELVHIGKGSGNQVVLSDPAMAEHSASIVSRNGRFAIYTSLAEGIEVEGNAIPPERWVWLPPEASVKLSSRTQCQFVSPEVEDAVEPPEPPRTAEARARKGSEPEQSVEKAKKASRKNIARFITDGPGDPLVKLGADGHLPELRLAVGHVRERDATEKSTNPWLLYTAIGASFLMSLALLFIDAETTTEGTDKSQARREISRYYGEENEPLAPYQMALRRAKLAHSRKDDTAERNEYRYVLRLLRAEGQEQSISGLTGNRNQRSDDELESLVTTLLSD